ncbi:hypothetical protein AGABI1DRAFT_114712 [Agaricus bisporus var. burnettii JB137-S8]|uniref:Uncharacterized protein n=1 Tax=Agaricus bisporus var. burnettii (strain JB137-S8 / ATCC MYA-4627 / FGSC 10392) TaxID=597362 RepID=K5X5F7_AGABU|nr:uncharacterized protein AGABI1DRAFT_114712 [Agaricus bisporus var. burnettii JB137-S8]EKM78428.1 hypothetical protein AGABI1DRAFT_114712 [Agaricus bisporus var. burnettii JB137-S8]
MRSCLQLSCFIFPFILVLSVLGVPTSVGVVRGNNVHDSIQGRTTPSFPDQPPSCPICAKDYPSISGCAEAAPVLQNFTNVIFNPGAFIDVIRCACVDTFQAVFPQCVDCFIKTGQEDILNTPDLPGVVEGMRNVCAVASSLLRNVSATNGESTPSDNVPPPSPTNSAPAQILERILMTTVTAVFIILTGFIVL